MIMSGAIFKLAYVGGICEVQINRNKSTYFKQKQQNKK